MENSAIRSEIFMPFLINYLNAGLEFASLGITMD